MDEDEGRSENGSDDTGNHVARSLDPAVQAELRETTARVLASLTPREGRVLRLHFGIDMNADRTLEEVGRQFSVTRERIRQIEARARRRFATRPRRKSRTRACWELNPRIRRAKHRYAFRPVTVDDLSMIAAWLRSPHVARWWPDPARQVETIRRHLTEPGCEPLLMLLDGRPVGYLQVYDASPGAVGAIAYQPDGTRGLDLFIGETRALGRGHGAAFLRRIAGRLLSDPGVRRLIADPDPRNRRSLSCFGKAGFRRGGLIGPPRGPAVLMVFTKGDLG